MRLFLSKLKPVLHFLNHHVGELIGYMGIRAAFTIVVISLVSLVLLIARGEALPLMVLIPPAFFFLSRPVLRRREWRLMSTYLDGESRPLPTKARPWNSWWIRALEALDANRNRRRENPGLRRLVISWRLERIMWEALILVPFLAVGVAVAWGTARPLFVYAVLTALIAGWGFAAGGIAPVFALLLVERAFPKKEGESILQ